ncbi:Uncharacterised protein [Yersinia enterocolitica]|nr:Uncharacterised protein [Yersinia enterocolitica]
MVRNIPTCFCPAAYFSVKAMVFINSMRRISGLEILAITLSIRSMRSPVSIFSNWQLLRYSRLDWRRANTSRMACLLAYADLSRLTLPTAINNASRQRVRCALSLRSHHSGLTSRDRLAIAEVISNRPFRYLRQCIGVILKARAILARSPYILTCVSVCHKTALSP